jgi:hypothetical protein
MINASFLSLENVSEKNDTLCFEYSRYMLFFYVMKTLHFRQRGRHIFAAGSQRFISV